MSAENDTKMSPLSQRESPFSRLNIKDSAVNATIVTKESCIGADTILESKGTSCSALSLIHMARLSAKCNRPQNFVTLSPTLRKLGCNEAKFYNKKNTMNLSDIRKFPVLFYL